MRNKARISLLTVLLLTAPAFAFEENSLNLGRFDRVDLEAGLLSRNEGPRLAAVCFLGFGNCDTEAGYGARTQGECARGKQGEVWLSYALLFRNTTAVM